MDNLFGIARRLFGAKHKVKLLAVILAHLPTLVYAADYGPYVVEQAALWLPDYLHGHSHGITQKTPGLLTDIYNLAVQFRRQNFNGKHIRKPGSPYFEPKVTRGPRIQFREGGDPIFNLAGRPPRMAVTGTALDSDVIFNLGLISDPKTFTFSEALGLWIHELGHKLPAGKYTQEQIDEIAGFISQQYSDQMLTNPVGSAVLAVINLVPYDREGDLHAGPFPIAEARKSSFFGIFSGAGFTDLTPQFNAELDKFSHPLSNKLETVRNVLEILPTREGPEGYEFFIHLRTSRFPKSLDSYVVDEMGPHYHKSARLVLSADLKTLTAFQYRDEPAPRQLITDADAEFSGPLITPDHTELRFLLSLHLKNQTHFHAAGYPDWRFQVNGLLDGEPVRLQAKVRWRMDKLSTGMPHEIHKKEFAKLGAVTIDLREIQGQDLQLIGMEDRFFTLGAGYEGPEGEQKRILLRQPLRIDLSHCENLLKPW